MAKIQIKSLLKSLLVGTLIATPIYFTLTSCSTKKANIVTIEKDGTQDTITPFLAKLNYVNNITKDFTNDFSSEINFVAKNYTFDQLIYSVITYDGTHDNVTEKFTIDYTNKKIESSNTYVEQDVTKIYTSWYIYKKESDKSLTISWQQNSERAITANTKDLTKRYYNPIGNNQHYVFFTDEGSTKGFFIMAECCPNVTW